MAKKSTKKSTEPKTDESAAPATTEKVSPAAEPTKNAPTGTNFNSSKSADTLQAEFKKIVEKFERTDDAITRYMLRDEMNQLKKDLDAKGIKVDLP